MYCRLHRVMSDEQNLLEDPVSTLTSSASRNYSQVSRSMPPPSRESLVSALLEQLPEQSSPVVIVVRPDKPAPAPIRTNGHRQNPSGPTYDPSVVFVLELSTIMATRDPESVKSLGQPVADALQGVVRDAANVHPLILSRAIFYLLFLLHASQVRLHLNTVNCHFH